MKTPDELLREAAALLEKAEFNLLIAEQELKECRVIYENLLEEMGVEK